MKGLSPIILISMGFFVLALSFLLQFTGPVLVLLAVFMALFLPFLWINKGRFFLFVFLGTFIPIFPSIGIEISGRMLNWFDLFLLGFALWNALHFFNDEVRSRLDKISLASILFLFILSWSVVRSPDIAISIRDYISYVVNFFLVYWIAARFCSNEIYIYFACILSSSIAVFLVAAFQKINGFTFPSVEDGEVTTRLGVPGPFDDSLVLSMFGGIMVILCLMAFVKYRHSHLRMLCILALIANLGSIRLALSRNGMFIVAVAILLFLVLQFVDWIRDRNRALAIPIVLLSLPVFSWAALLALPQDLYHRIVSIFYLFQGSNDPVILYNIRSTLGRFENYKMALKMFLSEPIEGIGLGMYPILTKFHDADGFYPGLLAETGMIGSLGFLLFAGILIFVLSQRLIDSYKDSQRDSRQFFQLFYCLTLALLAVSFFEPVFKVQWVSFTFFFLLRQVLGFDENESFSKGTGCI